MSDAYSMTTPQGATSSTWNCPPYSDDLSIPDLYAFHAKESPDHPAFAYDNESGGIRDLTYKEVFLAIRKAARVISENVQASDGETASDGSVIGILAVSDSVSYLTALVGTMYLGHTPFPLSPRNSAAGVAHLIRVTSMHDLFVSSDVGMQRIAQDAKAELDREGYNLELHQMPRYDRLYDDKDTPSDAQVTTTHADKVALIVHSSGSTSTFPKPIRMLQRNYVRHAYYLVYGELDMCGRRVSMHCVPPFREYTYPAHITPDLNAAPDFMGLMSITWSLGTGMIPTVLRPAIPPIPATPSTVLDAVEKIGCRGLVSVPSFIQAWSQIPTALPVLRSLDFLMTGGAPLDKHVAEALRGRGVRLYTGYGSTETGSMARNVPAPDTIVGRDWEYFRIHPLVKYARIYQEGQPGLFELAIMDCPTWSPNVTNTTIDGHPAYATNDLLQEHPKDPDLFKVHGRMDDQIMLSTGEKTNPGPIEMILLQDPNVTGAVMFGRARFQNGVIIQPKDAFDPSDEVKLKAFRDKIWAAVERANKFAPSHSRLFKEMIMVTHPTKPIKYNSKGAPHRHLCLEAYADEIEDLYNRVEESSQVDIQPPAEWNDSTVRPYIRGLIIRVLRLPSISDDDDLFQQGCDRQMTWIRNTVLHALRKTTKVSIHDVPLNFVYANPTISALSAFLQRVAMGGIDKEDDQAAQLALMNRLLERYGTKFVAPRWASAGEANGRQGHSRVILITGTTGRLGSHLLSQLVIDPNVARVYALNRATSDATVSLNERQLQSFKTWGLDPDLLSNYKVSLHVVDLERPYFDLEQGLYKELLESVTDIIHNAWRVDFNVLLSSFEPLFAGTRNLLDFALSSTLVAGPKIVFISSIGVLRNYASNAPATETLDYGPDIATGRGYGESKWVAEQIFRRAIEETGLRGTVVRVGQLSGDTRIGGWNVKEWVPTIVRASQRMGSVPVKADTISWVPVDVAASSLVQMLDSDERILHLIAPHSVLWADVFHPISEWLGVRCVNVDDWLAQLRESYQDGQLEAHDSSDAAHTLYEFLKGTLVKNAPPLANTNALKASRSLAKLEPMGKGDALKWMSFWSSVGFLAA